MNTYNENLRSAIASVLNAGQLQLTAAESQYQAAEITFKYTREAAEAAGKGVKAAVQAMDFKSLIKAQGENSNALAVNLSASAMQADQYVKQATADAAVCAANVQVAANAIVKLASDIGSIFSITEAADASTDVATLAATVRDLMNKTACHAEEASAMGMQVSMLTSEISSAAVAGKVKATNDLLAGLLTVIEADFDAAAQAVKTGEAALINTIQQEMLAKGTYAGSGANYQSARKTYALCNDQLNLGLNVSGITATGFKVSFDPVKKIFADSMSPVENYYVFVVKTARKTIFSLSGAETLVSTPQDKRQLIIPVTAKAKGRITKQINISEVTDTDGDQLENNSEYVVFIYAAYTNEYKKVINNFDDFLSVASLPFKIK